ncbi:hypothetical protein LSH36_324g02051 [Paralvinella palmiformis]|uniref:Phosphodiesterase n=1 Tax=Paralvinella palmiformis TaxID=53620 RepID=A0AAD9JH24_9ANNE|nr:hypothetical protein LSH36_324g02051 [Paralvinella palmiformis]
MTSVRSSFCAVDGLLDGRRNCCDTEDAGSIPRQLSSPGQLWLEMKDDVHMHAHRRGGGSASAKRDNRFAHHGHLLIFLTVLCNPVVDKESDRVVAVFFVVCSNFSKEDHEHLNFLEKQFLVCYGRLKQTRIATVTNCTKERRNSTYPILKLCEDLFDQDAASLQIKVLRYLLQHTNCQSGCVILVDADHRELFCQVIGGSKLEQEIRFPIDQNNIFSRVLTNKKLITLQDIDPEKKKKLEIELGVEVESLLCVPVCSRVTGDVVAIACMINKNDADSFSEVDIETVVHCFKYTATVLHSTISVQNERFLKNQTQALLQVARNLFTHLDDLTRLLREIMQEARSLTKAERCSVFLLERETNELVAKVFDGDVQEGKESEVRLPADQGIAGHVATTGELLNIDDAYSHPLFYRGVDETTGFRTRNILCFPIKNENDEVIGVAQLCNKVNGVGFSSFDEDIAQAFSVFCCMSIVHSLMYKRVRDAQHRSNLSNELMAYHMQVSLEEVMRHAMVPIPPPQFFDPDMDKFHYIPRNLAYDQTPLAVMSMFEDMGFISRHRIGRETLTKFVLMVRKGYRDPPYHNWAHAFAVAHFCYLMHKNLGLQDLFGELEVFALFVACLCHDIDHRGTTNSYQVASESVLAALYSSEGSVMEDYEKVLDLVKDIVLATDLAHHLKIVDDINAMAKAGYDKNNLKHRRLLLCLLMTSCDLSDQTKTWMNSKKIAELIYQEFFSQGDMERKMGRNPSEMMDRCKACIPELQIGFLDGIALPVFRTLTQIFPDAVVVVKAVENNRLMWTRVAKKLKDLNLPSNMDVFKMNLNEEALASS